MASRLPLWSRLFLGNPGSTVWASVVVVHRLRCTTAYGIFWFRDPTASPVLPGGFFATGLSREVHSQTLNMPS